jgi:hypothetical protein
MKPKVNPAIRRTDDRSVTARKIKQTALAAKHAVVRNDQAEVRAG